MSNARRVHGNVIRGGVSHRSRAGSKGAARSRGGPVVMYEFQRARILAAALEEADERSYSRTSVTAIVERARVSRKTFYELFDDRRACFKALFYEAVAQIADVVAPLYLDGEDKWSERVRAALAALLGFLDRDRDVGAFVLEYVIEGASDDPEARAWLFDRLRSVAEDGRSQAQTRFETPFLADEAVLGGVLVILHSRLQARTTHLTGLLNQLMWMIVLPHGGPAVAARELRQATPSTSAMRTKPTKPAKSPLDGLEMRVTYRTARVLAAIADGPGRSNVELGAEVEVSDAGQISKLLTRLEGLDLVSNRGAGHAHGAANAWHLTHKGREVDAVIRHQFAAGGPLRSKP
jgi:AcrR family transcriptional regulator